MRGTLVIFVKAPVAGRVKTRLARDLGPARAAAIFRHLTTQTIAEARRGPWRTILAVDPPASARGFSHTWPPRMPRVAQARGDLGERMAAAFGAAPEGPALIIGADAPAVRAPNIRQAFRALAAHDFVFGPSDDGGFWLVGCARRRAFSAIFEGVRWSTKHALGDAMASLPKGASIAFVSALRDVDNVADLRAIGSRAFMRSLARI